jgi:hypothetical protein
MTFLLKKTVKPAIIRLLWQFAAFVPGPCACGTSDTREAQQISGPCSGFNGISFCKEIHSTVRPNTEFLYASFHLSRGRRESKIRRGLKPYFSNKQREFILKCGVHAANSSICQNDFDFGAKYEQYRTRTASKFPV